METQSNSIWKLDVRHGDKLFSDSPMAGDLDCLCSRCGEIIQEEEVPIRMWTTNENGEVDDNSQEYRFCEKCGLDRIDISSAKNNGA